MIYAQEMKIINIIRKYSLSNSKSYIKFQRQGIAHTQLKMVHVGCSFCRLTRTASDWSRVSVSQYWPYYVSHADNPFACMHTPVPTRTNEPDQTVYSFLPHTHTNTQKSKVFLPLCGCKVLYINIVITTQEGTLIFKMPLIWKVDLRIYMITAKRL